MKKLKPLQEKQITLTSGQLDLRTPSGRASEGTFRLLVNVIGDSRGRLKRMGGWRRLTLTPASESTTFAIVGDYGFSDSNQRAVASMVTGWSPEYIFTTGDNIYGLNSGMTLQQANARFDAVIDAGYRDYYDDGLLYPVIGNHDTDYDPGNPTWFRGKFPDLFGDKNYYRIRKGQAEFFMLSSGYLTGGASFEPDGNTVGSAQYLWLQAALADSTATFKVVVLHHPPYTSDENYSPGETDLRWNFEAMGADLVLSGHAHNYERRKDRDIPYVISGNGGATLRGYTGVDTEVSVVDDPPRFGALRCVVNERSLRIESIVVGGEVIDEFELCKGTNEDLHDQLITNYDSGANLAAMPTIQVGGLDAEASVTAGVDADMPEIEVTFA